MKLKEIAAKIDDHLKRMEADPNINRRPNGRPRFFWAGAGAAGRWIRVIYISYQGASPLTKAEAERYLAYLDDGGTGRHFEALQ